MLRRSLLLLSVLLSLVSLQAQKVDKKLQARLNSLLTSFKGDVGIYVKNLESGRTVSINADAVFPTASMIKIPILIGVMDKINRGELSYHQDLLYRDSLLYAGVDLLGSFKPNEKIDLSKVLMLMLTMSDNTASLWLQSLAGGGTVINSLMEEAGLKQTRVNSRTTGRENDRTLFGWGQTTAYEMAALMEKIVAGKVVSKEKSNLMLRLLGRNYWDEYALSQIPADVFVASKGGAVNGSRNEVLFVNGRGARYIFCICTKNNKDESWTPANEAWVLTQKVSALLWDHFSN
ncbi:MAG: serine hydrolase [Chitinophagaceae bacterium]